MRAPIRTAALLGVCALACASAAAGASAPRTYTLRFAALASCEAASHKPSTAPQFGSDVAELTMPAGWHTIRVPPYTGSGLRCTTPELLSDRHGDHSLCVPVTVTAEASKNSSGLSLAAYLRIGGSEVGHGTLPADHGMRGIWEELDIGMLPAYAIVAAYQAAGSDLVYEVTIGPTQPPVAGCPHGSSASSRAFGRAIARSFRLRLTG